MVIFVSVVKSSYSTDTHSSSFFSSEDDRPFPVFASVSEDYKRIMWWSHDTLSYTHTYLLSHHQEHYLQHMHTPLRLHGVKKNLEKSVWQITNRSAASTNCDIKASQLSPQMYKFCAIQPSSKATLCISLTTSTSVWLLPKKRSSSSMPLMWRFQMIWSCTLTSSSVRWGK